MGRVFLLFVEDLAEERGVVAEELFVKDPLGVVRADVDVDHAPGEEPVILLELVNALNMSRYIEQEEEAVNG